MAINKSAIERGISEAFVKFARGQGAAYKAAIADNLYEWPNPTQRNNGERVFRPRNIVDLGNLRDSQQVKLEPFQSTYTWGGGQVDYAVHVFYGYSTGDGKTFPGRNWIGKAHDQSDPLEAFGRESRRVFN